MHKFRLLLITTLISLFSTFCFAAENECSSLNRRSLIDELNSEHRLYDIAFWENFSKTDQQKIFEITQIKCPHVAATSDSSFAILLKHKIFNQYMVVLASATDCECPPWNFRTVEIFKNDIPLINKITSENYKDININPCIS